MRPVAMSGVPTYTEAVAGVVSEAPPMMYAFPAKKATPACARASGSGVPAAQVLSPAASMAATETFVVARRGAPLVPPM